MEVNSEVWIRSNKIQSKKSNDMSFWSEVTIVSKEITENGDVIINVKDKQGNEKKLSTQEKTLDVDGIQPKNDVFDEDEIISCENLIDLPYLNEPEILNILSMRYNNNLIYTYTGNILIAINPLKNITPAESCSYFLQKFATDIKQLAVAAIKEPSQGGNSTGSGGMMMLGNHSIIISGASGSGKTECAKLLTKYLIDLQFTGGIENFSGFEEDALTGDVDELSTIEQDVHEGEGLSGGNVDENDSTIRNSFVSARNSNLSTDISMNSPNKKKNKKENSRRSFYRAYQLSTMEKIQHSSPILEAFANANTATTQNSSRFGKYMELSFTSRGDLVGGSISTYLLENVRVTKHSLGERSFNIFYQLIQGANDSERINWALREDGQYYFTNQGRGRLKFESTTSEISLVDKNKFILLKDHLFGLGFKINSIENIFEIVAGILHLGEIEFNTVVALEGQTAQISDKLTGASVPADQSEASAAETELNASARLCRVSVDELAQTLTKRSVLLNKEIFTKALTPVQAFSSRDALARAIYKALFNWIVKEINSSLKPLEAESAVSAHVGILDIFGFDSFTVNSFEQLCINFANETLQQHFNMHMFKLEMQEYQLEGISFESIGFTDNQESIDCISAGIFKVLDDQCRIPNPSDKRFASQIYKELEGISNPTFAMRFSVTKAQKVLDHFCIEHFAGPVVYTTSMFIEKNSDSLPQAASTLLRHSNNFIIATAAEELSNDKVLAAAAAFASPTSKSTSQRSAANVKNTPSMVAQLRNELTFMMSNINKTIPHYVCCISPVERELHNNNSNSINKKTTTPSKFHLNTVALQLRYAGILEAVKMARLSFPNRYPHLTFYQRYRFLANPHHELTQHLPHQFISNDGRAQCEQLILTLINTVDSENSMVESTLKAQLNALTFTDKVQSNKDSSSSISKFKYMIGGVANKKGVVAGLTKVFLDKQTHSCLELYRSQLVELCSSKIGNFIFKYITKSRKQKFHMSVNTVQRIIRGSLGRMRFHQTKKDLVSSKILVQPLVEIEEVFIDESQVEVVVDEEVVPFVCPSFTVIDYKQQDLLIQEEITKLVTSTKVTDEEAILLVDIEQTKQELSTAIKEFDSAGAFRAKTLEVIDLLEDGHLLIKSDKLIPLTRSGKIFSMGRHVKTENRTSSVKSANKSITTEHIVFKPFIKLQGCLRELFELAKLEKGMLETKSKSSESDIKLNLIGKIAQKARSLYQHYTHYVTQFVKEYGNDSAYKTSFKDDNQYLLALVQEVESQKPLLASEKTIKSSDPSTKFPLFIPPKNSLGPQHLGYNTIFTSNKVSFKAIAHDPGLEYAFNSFYELLKGYKLMYPIKYLRVVGKSYSNEGKECFYQASLKFSAHNLSAITSTTLLAEKMQILSKSNLSTPPVVLSSSKFTSDSIDQNDFSFFALTSILCGSSDMRCENIMIDSLTPVDSCSKTSLIGINIDDTMTTSLFGKDCRTDTFNVLYLLPQMDQPISSTLKDILSLPMAVESHIFKWIRELHLQNKRFHHLKTIGFTSNDFNTLNIPTHLPEGFVDILYSRMKELRQTIIDESSSSQLITHSDVLTIFNPELSQFYSQLRSQYIGSDNTSSFIQVYENLLSGIVLDSKLLPQRNGEEDGAEIEQCASDFIKSLNFSLLIEPSHENESIFNEMFNCISFLQSITLHSISEKQLSAMFSPILSTAKNVSSTQNKLLQAQLGSKFSGNRTAVPHITLKNIKFIGCKSIMNSVLVQDLKNFLSIKISFGD